MRQEHKWWQLYATVPLSVGLLWLASLLPLEPQGRQWLQMGIVLVSFGLMALWVHANHNAAAEESAPHIAYFHLLDPKCRQPLNYQVEVLERSPHADMDESISVDPKGRYN